MSSKSGRGVARRRSFLRPTGYAWILPALVFCVGLLYYSVGYTGYISTLDWNGTAPDPTHVGSANYGRAFADPVFWEAIQHTVISFVVTFTISTILGFVFAALLHSRPFFGGVYKVVLFVPVVLAPAIMAPVFRQIFANDGQFNWLLDHLGLGALAQPWLAQSGTALGVILAITIWGGTGVTFILYFAAMGQIDPELLEAAELDGAGNIRRLVSIIWPNVRGTTIALATLSAIGALKTFDIPYLVTTGGPNFATEFLGTLIYRMSIPLGAVGYGAALSILLLLIALVFAILLNARRDKGEGRNDA
ncbi:MAG: sugar transporter permease [Glaciihabitans sp.]|jgi:raffinose/stachyose/melibiose transport system permease protein|nr:sugar transporter permease [Glaciihabitans sp.]MDQ1570606.1 raffinose/stachyose/melibiose transport system permease protein [Actinomycetota bacterium]